MTLEIENFVKKSIEEEFKKMSLKLDKTYRLQEKLIETVVELLKSSDDVGQLTTKKILNRKLKSSLLHTKTSFRKIREQSRSQEYILSDENSLPLPSSPELSPSPALADRTHGLTRGFNNTEFGNLSSVVDMKRKLSSEEEFQLELPIKKRSKLEYFKLSDGNFLPVPSSPETSATP